MKVHEKNRILMLLENLPYPQDLRVRREANALNAAGYRVTVICPRAKGQPFRETIAGVKVRRYPAPVSSSGFLGYVWEYLYSIVVSFAISLLVFLEDGFDVVHAHNPPDTFVFVAIFYKLFGKQFVYDHHDLSPEMYQAKFPGGGNHKVYDALVFLEKLTCRVADHVIVTNESYKKVAMERCQVPEERITTVRNGIELSHLQQDLTPDPGLRAMGKSIIAFVGMMGGQDGLDYLLRALHYLAFEMGRTDFHCILIGFGDALNDLKVLAKKLALDEYVRFMGPVFGDDLRRYLCAADICVDSSPSNPYSDRSTIFKIMEYMSLGKPIVVFDLQEHRVTAQRAAVYVTPNDERAFARALSDLMDDPERRAALSEFGRRRLREELAWDFSVPRLLHVYRTVLPLQGEARTSLSQGRRDSYAVPRSTRGFTTTK
jgi:glycosyltransferase involved in cell wall biosynthesis